jgi:serine/threonine protein kinase
MLNKTGVRKESDFYCLGTVLYEMIVGEPPYFANDVDTLYSNIKTSKLTFPKQVSEEARNLLSGLLERTPEKRLGYKGIHEIKNHRFFKNLNWSALEKRLIKAPIREEIDGDDEDYTNFVQV